MLQEFRVTRSIKRFLINIHTFETNILNILPVYTQQICEPICKCRNQNGFKTALYKMLKMSNRNYNAP